MFKSFNLQSKLLGIIGFLLFVSVGIGVNAIFSLKKVSSEYEHIADVNLPNTRTLAEMRIETLNLVRNVIWFAAPGSTPKELAHFHDEIAKAKKNYEDANGKYSGSTLSKEELALHSQLDSDWKALLDISAKTVADLDSAKPEDRERGMALLKGDFYKVYHDVFAKIGELVEAQTLQSKKYVASSQSIASASSTTSVLVLIFTTIAGIAVGLAFSRALARALSTVTRTLSSGADQLTSAAAGIASASTQLSQGVNQQATALQETVSSIDEVSAMVSKNTENAKESSQLSAEGTSTANQGKRAVEQMIQSIHEISQSTDQINQQITDSNLELARIISMIQEIGAKTKVINDIVFQTRLLSFNASVEAARAGEHGKGFAVVAEEVGNLAQMSGTAAQEISRLLETSTKQVEEIINGTKAKVEALARQSREKVDAGSSKAQECQDVLDRLLKSVETINQRIGSVASASEDQNRGVRDITQAMNQLDQVTQQNSAASQHTAAAAEQISSESDRLREIIQELEQIVEGSARKAA